MMKLAVLFFATICFALFFMWVGWKMSNAVFRRALDKRNMIYADGGVYTLDNIPVEEIGR